LLFIAYKYSDSTEKAILANANAGGENVARGALLGALFGAQYGFNGIPKWA
jgi:ADP-ribosyl-[dinitrogen reductase] hydrolase